MALYKRAVLLWASCLLVLALVQSSEADQGQDVANYVANLATPAGYNAVAFRKSASCFPELVDAHYTETNIGTERYGVWVFKCGKFRTGGARGSHTWDYKGPCWYTTQSGNMVNFQHPECPDETLRWMNDCGYKDGRR